MRAQLAVGEPHGQQPEGEQGGEQRLDARVAEAKRRHAPVVHHGRAMQLLEGLHTERAVVAEPLDAQPASVGGEADLFQVIEVAQPSADGEVVGVVDDGLGAQCAPFLVVLLG